MSEVPLRPVALLGIPLDVHRRNSEHGETLRRELAFVEHASHPDAPPVRLHLLGVSLVERYGGLTAAQDERLAEALAADEPSVDLHYELPVEVADACDELEALLDELDDFCRDGDLLTLVTPPEGRAYRRWFLGEVREQLREGRPPRPWSRPADLEEPPVDPPAPRAGTTATIVVSEDLDLSLAPTLREEIVGRTEEGVTCVTVDVSGCPFIDSTGISLLLTTHVRLAAEGGWLRVAGARGQVARVLRMSGVDELLAGTSG